MRSLIIALALGAAAAPSGGAPASSAAAPALSGEALVQQKARHLAQLTNPVEVMADAEVRQFDKAFIPMLRTNENVAALEVDHPGLLNAVYAAARGLVAPYMRREIPVLQAEMAKLYAARFSASELDDLTTFYESPTGQRLIGGVIANQDVRGIAEEYMKTGSFGQESIEAQKRSAVAKTMGELEQRDRDALLAFSKSPAFPKLAAIRSDATQILQTWMNRPTPEYDREMDAVIAKAMEDYMAQHPAKK
ncbi:MAG TPA: DUF2059 domain-containing protein [Sphingomicrobium sp.]